MFVLCLKCWKELAVVPGSCPTCGSSVDISSPTYARRLLAALAHAHPERRVQICEVLGSIADRSSVPALIELLHDPDILVRVAALRGLGEIRDPSAYAAVERATLTRNDAVRTMATRVLKSLGQSTGESARKVPLKSPEAANARGVIRAVES